MRFVQAYVVLSGLAVVSASPGGLPMLKASGISLYHDLGKFNFGGLIGTHHLSGIPVYKDLYGNGYYGLIGGIGKHTGISVYKKLGSGLYWTAKGLKKAGMMYSGFGSHLFGDYGPVGVLTNRYGPYGGKVYGAIYGGNGVPFGNGIGGSLLKGIHVKPQVGKIGPSYMMSY